MNLSVRLAKRQRCCGHSCAAILQHRKRRGGKLDDPLGDLADLSPLEILLAAAEVRKGWSPEETLQRLRPDWRTRPWTVPQVAEPDFVDLD